jgi:uncharacterized C2H2 Zn-finger protein
MDAAQPSQLTKKHLEEGMDECRWCFAVDMERVKARKVAQYDFPDATVIHLKCPRCGGEFSYYIRAWGENYIQNIVLKLHPELEGRIDDNLIREINNRMWPEFAQDC